MQGMVANVDQAKAWDGDEGRRWAEDYEHYDASVAAYHPLLLDAAAIGVRERVLDVGCGCGQSSCDAARQAREGAALGVDLSGPMLGRARSEAEREGLTNVRFEQADAQVHEFDSTFDVVISRNGAMFFADPQAAWRNIGSAVRSGGRLAVLCWTDLDANEWMRTMHDAVDMGRGLPLPPVGVPGPFGLGDADRTTAWLHAGGFHDVTFERWAEPFHAGRDPDDAFAFVQRTMFVVGALAPLDDTEKAEALGRLHAALRSHDTADGVVFESEAFLITATKT